MQNAQWNQEPDHGGKYFALHGHPKLTAFRQAFSTRLGGMSIPPFASLNLGFSTGDSPRAVKANRALFLQTLDVAPQQLRTLRQNHSTLIHWIDNQEEAPEPPPEGDALITDVPGLLLGVLTADCCPILLADPHQKVVAAIHAGWKGSKDGITRLTINSLTAIHGCQPSSLIALIGPTIGPCCYQVGAEVRAAFLAQHAFCEGLFTIDRENSNREPRWKLDLPSFHRLLLQQCGVSPQNIFTLPLCTRCHEKLFFSYRRDGNKTGRMLSVIGLIR